MGQLLLKPSQLRCEVPAWRRKPQARPAWRTLQVYMALSSPGRCVDPRLHTRHMACPTDTRDALLAVSCLLSPEIMSTD